MGGGGKHYTPEHISKIEIHVPEPVKNKTIKAKNKRSKKMDKKIININYRDIEEKLSNGDWKNGRKIMSEIAERLDHARTKHPKEEWKNMPQGQAYYKLYDEVREVQYAIYYENKEERVYDELLDVIAVAIRMLNHEYGE